MRTVVITGASTGIGAAAALRLDRRGWCVFAGVRRAADGARLQRRASPRLIPLLLDITEQGAITTALALVAETVGDTGLAGLVNNAGMVVASPLEFVPLDTLRDLLEVNVVGQVAVTQAFLPLLRRGRGRVVNVGSISGRLTLPLLGAYSASKAALEALTTALRLELRPWNIPVAMVEPGGVATPIWQKSLAALDAQVARLPPPAHTLYGHALAAERRRNLAGANAGASPDIVARAIVHALTARHPKLRYVTGQRAQLGELVRLLPEGLRDWLLARYMRM